TFSPPGPEVTTTGLITGMIIDQPYKVKVSDGTCTSDESSEFSNSAKPLMLNAKIVPDSMYQEICANDGNGQFTIEINGGITPYEVSIDNRTGIYTPTSDNNHTFDNLSGGLHTVYIKDALNCTFELEVQIQNGVTINPKTVVHYDCVDDLPHNAVTVTVDRSITNLSDVDYSLDGDASEYQTSNVFTNLAPGKHFIRVRHSSSCEKDTEDFTINEVQPLELKLDNTELNQLTATTTGGDGGYQYSFQGESFSSSNKLTIYKTGTYKIIATDRKGCSVTKTIFANYVDVCIPNYFTPNGDGANDQWGPGCTNIYKNLTYTVFDRYGREIVNYGLNQKWDGKYNGVELPAGDYWYVLKLNDINDNREFVGHFNLYR
ncbi:T9SS type B sorting domain-containing protein, partial [Flavobacterium sp. MC2016-06]|uniref:T9SS type B sorting domain-containing protein n=1 Tax=Flavobacterium sp. MC2016-06 TaxID=2676308 RepID=UPI0031DBDD63